MKSRKIIYARGFPYGAPLVHLRGGATRDPLVKDAIKLAGFRWDSSMHAWKTYMDRLDLGTVLKALRDEFGCDIEPKDGMDENYILDLNDPRY